MSLKMSINTSVSRLAFEKLPFKNLRNSYTLSAVRSALFLFLWLSLVILVLIGSCKSWV